jgi:hypothetical protein
VLKKTLLPKRPGNFVAGDANAPPTIGPKMLPICHTSGSTENARGCNSFCGTISATAVLKIPTFPLLAPEHALATIAHGKLLENPNSKIDAHAQLIADSMAGLRP